MRRIVCACAALLLTTGCDDAGGPAATSRADAAHPADARPEAAPPDAAPEAPLDATAPDAAPRDAAEPDAGADDAATADAAPVEPRPYPAPGAWGPNRGPGGPAISFGEEQLFQHCAVLDPGPDDTTRHRNLVTMYDGYLLMPWSPEWGLTGGLTFFDVADPCNPRVVGHGTTDLMRESHSIGFSHIGGRWAVTNHQRRLRFGGVLFWDLADIEHPQVASALELPGYFYPDSYARLALSVFWQAPYVYVAGADNGVWIVDGTDPRDPQFVNQYVFDPILRAGQVQAIGNLLVVTAAEGSRTALLDISDPANPQPIPGGDFEARDEHGEPREAYFTNTANGYVYYARKEGGGGLIVYDIRDPSRPLRAGGYTSDGNGGYVFVKDQFAFVGESSFAAIYDLSDLGDIREVARLHLEGDLDTVTPIGNVAVLAVDDKPEDDRATVIAPWATEVDATPPRVTWAWPADGATGVALTSRFGLTFNEFVDARSAWEGSVRLYEADTDPALTRVDGHVSAQENIVNFWPARPLRPGTRYVLEVPAGGVVDFNGNAVAEPFALSFTTVGR